MFGIFKTFIIFVLSNQLKPKTMKTYRIGFFLMIGGFIFSIIETKYFGWNLTPQSTPELICDMIVFFSIMLGFLIFCSKPIKTKDNGISTKI